MVIESMHNGEEWVYLSYPELRRSWSEASSDSKDEGVAKADSEAESTAYGLL